ncbi:hypothetical protein K502DRAFT_289952 [Neoconidiobolus thromboides FSU 785]|nr:hypothetical protein K502DRAFT_289952 [Neoconidiobolus thromboides FSU 785]
MCQVCLTEYVDKDALRILKCQHAFHTDCIDKWLTTGSNNCPVCRRPGTVKNYKPEKKEGEGEGGSYVSLVHENDNTESAN